MKTKVKVFKLCMTAVVALCLTLYILLNRETKDWEELPDIDPNLQLLPSPRLVEDLKVIVLLAKKIARPQNGRIMVTMVNNAYLPFAYSWLCNTEEFGIHKSVLIITTDVQSKTKLAHDWPKISVFHTDLNISVGDQRYSRVGYVNIMVARTEIILALLEAGLDVLLFEVDCLWLGNPLADFAARGGYEIAMNPVAERKDLYAGGFCYLLSTDRVRDLWRALTHKMRILAEKIKLLPANSKISEEENDQIYLSKLIFEKYTDLKIKELPLERYQDGKWYTFSEAKRNTTRPIIINNNWVIGNQAKIERAKKWGHWFLKEDGNCDSQQVKRVVHPV